MQTDEVFKLSELTRYVQQVLSINFESSFWIEAEVNQISESRGNYYLELIEKDQDSDQVLAVVQGRIWRSSTTIIRRKLNAEIKDYLQAGMQVKLKGSIKFHDVYGLSFQIVDIDKDFTIGELERRKLETIAKLTAEGTFDINKTIELSPVVQRLAVISSRTAAGLADFINQLQSNQHDIPFQIDFYHATVQGTQAVPDITHALEEISEYAEFYDAVCILRGGGSKLDLSAFDDASLARTIASMPIPVLTGIGHEIDTSIADMTSHSYLKTPTALAAFLIDRNAGFLNDIYNAYQRAMQSAKRHMQYLYKDLSALRRRIEVSADSVLQDQKRQLQHQAQRGEYIALSTLGTIKQDLHIFKTKALASDPQHVLKRGFALLSQNNSIIKSINEIDPKTKVAVRLHDGQFETKISE